MTTLLIVSASAAGWAILALAIVVLYNMDLRDGRVAVAAGWFMAAMAGAYLALVPGIERIAPHWATVVLAVSVAIGGWLNLAGLLAQAMSPSPWSASVRAAAFAGAAGVIATSFSPATASFGREQKATTTKQAPQPELRHDQVG
jgi:hypothetical protein